MGNKERPAKKNLSLLRFEIIKDSSDNKPLFEGELKDIVEYLQKRGTDGLQVLAVDIDSWTTMEPMPAKKFMEWYELIVIPQLKSADYSDELSFYFPNEHLEIIDGNK